MTAKELREIKRRIRPEKSNIPKIVGCLVNGNKAVVSKINQPLGAADSLVSEKLLSAMRKTLSGTIGVNLTEISFSTAEVSGSEEHKLLMELRRTRLSDEGVLDKFYRRVADSLNFEGNYLILLANDLYDVFSYSKDGERADSGETFSYILCAICPIKSLNETVSFKESDNLFHPMSAISVLSSPEAGFMFPTFDDRKTNIYGALYYARGMAENYPDLLMNLFKREAYMPPKAQKEAFSQCLSDTLGGDCSLEVVKALHNRVEELQKAAKESKDEEPVILSRGVVKNILEDYGVGEEKLEELGKAFDESFGVGAEIVPKNLISTNKFEVKTPEVSIKVDPEYKDLISTRTVNGERYVLIKVMGDVSINGITLSKEE